MTKFIFFITVFNTFFGFSQTVSTVAGTTPGYFDAPGEFAQFSGVTGICADNTGNIYLVDSGNNRIRKIDTTNDNMVSTFAGSGVEGYEDGIGTTAAFAGPNGICIDTQNNLYITDFWNYKIRKITPAGVVTTVAGTTQGFTDGNGITAKFGYLEGICIDSQNNLYVADAGNHKIRKITPTGIVSTVAGTISGYLDGAGSVAKFDYPNGICIDSNNNLYVAEAFGAKIRRITPSNIVNTIAGSNSGFLNGQGISAKFFYPTGICTDNLGNLFVADNGNHKIRKIATTGMVTTYAGIDYGFLDGDINTALFCSPQGIMTTVDGTIYVTQACGNPSIRKITSILNIENFVSKKMILFPNPNNGSFEISLENECSITIYNFIGKKVYFENNIIDNKIINTNLPKGIYIIEIKDNIEKSNFIKMIIK